MTRYNCPYGLKAEETSFESLHCAITACKGVNERSRAFMEKCASCDDYVENARARDIKELSKPVGLEACASKR